MGTPFDSKTLATCESGDDEEVPTSEKITRREHSAELVELTSCFKQTGLEGVAAWVFHGGILGKTC